MTETKEHKIGDIGNHYGDLNIKTEDKEYFWSIDDCCGQSWEKIPKSLFIELVKYELPRLSVTIKSYDRKKEKLENWQIVDRHNATETRAEMKQFLRTLI